MIRETFPLHGHRMQHDDFPTWCVDCGTFDVYILPPRSSDRESCSGAGSSRFDTRTVPGLDNTVGSFFGTTGKDAVERVVARAVAS